MKPSLGYAWRMLDKIGELIVLRGVSYSHILHLGAGDAFLERDVFRIFSSFWCVLNYLFLLAHSAFFSAIVLFGISQKINQFSLIDVNYHF